MSAEHMPGAASGEVRRLVVLRHGRTAWNAEGRAQGHSDVSLDRFGHAEAAAAAPWIARLSPVALWSSDLARARETAAYVAKESGLDPVLDDRLREFALGERTGLTNAEFEARFPEQAAALRAGRWDPVPGMETSEELAQRVSAALVDLVASIEPGETAAVVAHGGAIKVGVSALLGWTPETAQALRHPVNCGWALLEHEGPLADGRWRLAAWNLSAPDPDFTSAPPVR
ncbi:histidine phosphatase family protein [Nocardioides jejuensis]|uniref:Histidine phosphatase family protein n=1 Tax=Nocardioides jejuensis TaxID=2502782 RepID=A0A4R1CHZ5_9ACTN|nr:histidine phosphatase family protein [Nocardioides jejuensis]TCJ31073.1 histidine phosphatase family protein [Nocardioides jejuensis]